MTSYMLDTNTVSDMMRNPAGRVAAQIAKLGRDTICVSIVTAGELRFGAAKTGSMRLLARVEAALGEVSVLPLDEPADVAYGRLRADLEAIGRPIGPNDLLIAAHALALGATVVTANVGEFRRVPGLNVENWLV